MIHNQTQCIQNQVWTLWNIKCYTSNNRGLEDGEYPLSTSVWDIFLKMLSTILMAVYAVDFFITNIRSTSNNNEFQWAETWRRAEFVTTPKS